MNRWTGSIFLIPLIALNAIVLWSWDAEWRGQWQWTIDTLTGTTALTAPLVAAFAGYLALSQRRLATMTDSTPRGPWVPVRCALQAWAWASVVYVVACMAAAGATLLMPHGGPAQWWAALVSLPVFAVAALTGVMVVRLWAHLAAVILLAPAFFLLAGFGPTWLGRLLRHGPTSGSWAGTEFVPATFWLTSVALLGLVGLLVVGLLVAGLRQLVLVGTLSGLIFLGAVIGLDAGGLERSRFSGERPVACAGTAPRICLAPSERRALTATAAAMRPAIEKLQEIDAELPARYEQLLPGYQPGTDVGMITDVAEAGSLRPLAAAQNVAQPAGCPGWTDPAVGPPDQAYDGMRLVANWILVRQGLSPDAWSRSEADWLRTSDSLEAEAVIRRLFVQLRSCDLAQIRLPWPAEPS